MKHGLSISTKIFFFALTTGAVIIVFFIASSMNIFSSIFDDLHKEHILSMTSSLDAGIETSDLSNVNKLQEIINKFIYSNPDVYHLDINILDESNNLTIRASNITKEIDLKADSENLNVFSNENTYWQNISTNNNEEGIRMITPFFSGGQKMGTYDLYLSTQESMMDFMQKMTKFLAIVSIIVIFVSGIFLFVIRITIVSPIKKLNKGVQIIGEGNLDYRVPVMSSDEIGELTQGFNESTSKLSNVYKNLENIVKEKTASITVSLEKIEVQNKSLENNKLAMINLLEDAKDLEVQLKDEKAGVEQKVINRTAELDEEKNKLTSTIFSLPVGFLMVDKSHNVLIINQVAKNILNLKNGDLKIFDDFLKLFPKDSILYQLHDDYHKEKIAIEKSAEIEFGPKTLSVSISPINGKDANGKLESLGNIVLIDDITEAKILDRSKDEFFSIASHELRTPLTAIRGNTSMILEYYAGALKDPELKAMVDDVHESSIRLINIVNDFLNVSRLEQGKMVYDIKEADIEALIPDIIKEYDVTGSRKNIGIEYQKPTTPLPLVLADIEKVRQILVNLIGNSLKFTEKGSIKITSDAVDDNVKISIKDTGRGISPEQQVLLFHKFQQAGASLFTRDTVGGTGLGLYISRMMIEGMKGKLTLEQSEVNKGSTFSITLPTVNKKTAEK